MPTLARKETTAEPPKAPPLTAGMRKAEAEWTMYRKERERVEWRSLLRGSILIALLVLLVSLVRAGVDRAFITGWWRQW